MVIAARGQGVGVRLPRPGGSGRESRVKFPWQSVRRSVHSRVTFQQKFYGSVLPGDGPKGYVCDK